MSIHTRRNSVLTPQIGTRRKVAALIATLGLLMIGQGFWIPVKAQLAQILIAQAWKRTLAGESDRAPWPWADTRPIARLSASAHHFEAFVLEGASGQALAFGPAHISTSASPGERDNVALAGHRDTHFNVLKAFRLGDYIELESETGITRYQVESRHVVHESEVRWAERSGHAELTLITCYPFDAIIPGGPMRYVVRATALAPDTRLASSSQPAP